MLIESKPKKCFSCPSTDFTTMILDDSNSGASVVLPLCTACQEEMAARDSKILKVLFRVKRTEFVRFLALCDGSKVNKNGDLHDHSK